jgi:biotin transport system substrate-specific component
MIAQTTTLAGLAAPKSEAARWGYTLALMILGSLVLWVSAKVHVPFYPVPQTLQSLAVVTIGAAFGWRLGAATVLLYLAEGALGLPVFSGTPERGIGVAYMMGPTGGYLLGFVLAAAAAGLFAEKGFDRTFPRMFIAMLVAAVIIHVPGLIWLGQFTGYDKALELGLLPFVWGDLLKVALAAVGFPAVWQVLKKD